MVYRVSLMFDRAAAVEERARLESILRQAEKAESLGRMAGAIAHHVNNKLTAVLGFLELAKDQIPETSRPGHDIRRAIHAAEEAARVGEQMLAYLGWGFDTHANVEQDPVTVGREVLASLGAGVSGIRLSLDARELEAAPVAILAGVGELHRVLENLVQNAMEAISGEGEVRLSLRLVPPESIVASPLLGPGWRPQPGPHLCLEVTDTGEGMAPGILHNAFDPFFTTKFTGRGLGLPMVLGIVRAHRGTLSVDTAPGRGSTFRVFLPLAAEGA
jgi:signal transduction histidine kinase